MHLSVIIVNYNVAYFLEQALLSVQKAAAGLDVEIIVVDNNSVDASVAMVQQKFPHVVLIANTVNTGFAVANNQGIAIAKGKYVLLLNPDTVVEENTFVQTLAFMDAHPNAGGLGVAMYDGKGVFLPESKRGLPTPWVAFCKMSGLATLFPHSKRFNYYYLGHLSNHETQSIEILSGAFMLLRRSALDKIGVLDEAFFMYGEDIDLSYRLLKGGYKNYYYPHTRIIHYKGESTKKGSLNYVRVFYNAMIIFARKHFDVSNVSVYVQLIQTAIYGRAALAIVARIAQQLFLPISDALLIYGGMYQIKLFWQTNIKAANHTYYAAEYMLINVPLYIVIWLTSAFFSGAYDLPLRNAPLVRGIFAGTVFIAAVYGFLPEDLRFSRGMIILGAVWAIFALSMWRYVLYFIQHRRLPNLDKHTTQQRAVIVGNADECERVHHVLQQMAAPLDIIGYVMPPHPSPNHTSNHNQTTFNGQHPELIIGHSGQLSEMVRIYHLNEIIFCARDISSQQIIQFMIDIGQNIDYKIVPTDSLSIIGSNSKHTAGDLYTVDIRLNISQPYYKRLKRLLDLGLSLLMLPLLPLLSLTMDNKLGLWRNCLRVLWGTHSWVGYHQLPSTETANQQDKPTNKPATETWQPKQLPQSRQQAMNRLPNIRIGILSPIDHLPAQYRQANTIYRLNLLYAKDYSIATDLEIIARNWRKCGDN
jgi:GT2 family glycosyltransferase